MKHYEHLEKALCSELEKLDKKYGGDVGEMSAQDVERADVLYHALKSAETWHAMKDPEGWEDKDASERSYRRGRDAMGRYTSRDMGHWDHDGGYSGYYPDWMPRYYR